MVLRHALFAENRRLQDAAQNSPPMSRGERDEQAVRLLQEGLFGAAVSPFRLSRRRDGTFDGDYGGETHRAVQRFQEREGLVRNGRGDGVAGRNTLHRLDQWLRENPARTPVVVTSGAEAVPEPDTPETTEAPQRMRIPDSDRMHRIYQGFRAVQGQVCRRPGQDPNQCTVRLSVALARADCGFHFGRWRLGFVHSGRGRCCDGDPIPEHVTNATNLSRYLAELGLPFERYESSNATEGRQARSHCEGRNGIVFFPHLDGGNGAHIDYQHAGTIMNEELNYWAAGEPPQTDAYYRRSRGTILFCPTG